MSSPLVRTVLALLLVVGVAACGDDDTETSTTDSPTTTTTTSTADDGSTDAPDGGAVELTADPPAQVPAGSVTWEVTVTNESDSPVTLTFPSGQRADATLETDDGTVVHRWSEEMSFTQQITELTFEPGESETFELDDDLSAVAPGDYALTLELTAVDPPEPVVTRVQVAPEG